MVYKDRASKFCPVYFVTYCLSSWLSQRWRIFLLNSRRITPFLSFQNRLLRILKCESEEEISKAFGIDLVPSITLFMMLQTCFSSYVYEKDVPKYLSVFLLLKELKFNNFLITLKMHFIHLDKKTKSNKRLANITQELFTIWAVLYTIILTVSIAKLCHRFKYKKMIFLSNNFSIESFSVLVFIV